MTYWELEKEPWELFPDDNYDGAKQMSHRGRIEILERSFKKSQETS